MNGLDGGAAIDTGAADTGDTSPDTGGESVEGVDSSPANDNGGETKAEQKLRLKWRGIEEEIDDPRKLAERFSDKYEYEFKGPGGKPVRKNWMDIERDVQMASGAQERMKQAHAMRQEIMQRREWARENNYANLPLVLKQEFGLEDPEEYFYNRAAERLNREAEMAQLAQSDPTAYHRRMQQMMQEQNAQEQKWAQTQAQRRQQQAEAQQRAQHRQQQVVAELRNVGLKENPHRIARAAYIARKYAEDFGDEMEPRQAAYEARKQIEAETLEILDSMDPEKLLSFLGEKRRTALRDAELAQTKAAQKLARTSAPAKRQPESTTDTNGNQHRPKSITDMLRGGFK